MLWYTNGNVTVVAQFDAMHFLFEIQKFTLPLSHKYLQPWYNCAMDSPDSSYRKLSPLLDKLKLSSTKPFIMEDGELRASMKIIDDTLDVVSLVDYHILLKLTYDMHMV
jgi:hypothetical protein